MSRPDTPPAATQPKLMSSRLMNMKFMQRASAASTRSPAATSAPSSEQLHKRHRTDFVSAASTPSRSGNKNGPQNVHASNGIARNVKEGQETPWVLKTTILQTSDHDEDDSEEDIWSTKNAGRQTYGKFTRQKAVPKTRARDDADADLSSASEGEVTDDDVVPDHHASVLKHATERVSNQRVSDTMSPLRKHGQKQDQKRKHSQLGGNDRKKARRTM